MCSSDLEAQIRKPNRFPQRRTNIQRNQGGRLFSIEVMAQAPGAGKGKGKRTKTSTITSTGNSTRQSGRNLNAQLNRTNLPHHSTTQLIRASQTLNFIAHSHRRHFIRLRGDQIVRQRSDCAAGPVGIASESAAALTGMLSVSPASYESNDVLLSSTDHAGQTPTCARRKACHQPAELRSSAVGSPAASFR